jgi:hypothetical protein
MVLSPLKGEGAVRDERYYFSGKRQGCDGAHGVTRPTWLGCKCLFFVGAGKLPAFTGGSPVPPGRRCHLVAGATWSPVPPGTIRTMLISPSGRG